MDGSPSSLAALRSAVRYAGLTVARVEVFEAWDMPGARGWSAPMVDIEFDE
ncbi:hypothetical protein ABZ532_30020 [Streptomyces sp. NPDC019396]|uniref:hypothetical protein n=1 Tax=Streptomyces sp. NPDC019396 TaxID=3154687 RepID=UPI0033D66F97